MLRVAADYDGVLFPFPKAASCWGIAERGIVLPEEPNERVYWRACGLDDGEWEAFLVDFGEDHGYRSQPPYREASRPATRAVEASTFRWTADWLLPLRSILIGPTAKLEVECDILVDDDPEALALVAELGETAGLLLDRPWNQDAEGFARVTWAELPGVVDALAAAVATAPESDRPYLLADLLDEIRVPD